MTWRELVQSVQHVRCVDRTRAWWQIALPAELSCKPFLGGGGRVLLRQGLTHSVALAALEFALRIKLPSNLPSSCLCLQNYRDPECALPSTLININKVNFAFPRLCVCLAQDIKSACRRCRMNIGPVTLKYVGKLRGRPTQ